MDYRTKYLISQAVLGVAIVCAVTGFGRLRGEVLAGHVTKLTVCMLFAGVVVGIVAGIASLYFKSRASGDIETQRAAIEALSVAGAKQPQKDKKE